MGIHIDDRYFIDLKNFDDFIFSEDPTKHASIVKAILREHELNIQYYNACEGLGHINSFFDDIEEEAQEAEKIIDEIEELKLTLHCYLFLNDTGLTTEEYEEAKRKYAEAHLFEPTESNGFEF